MQKLTKKQRAIIGNLDPKCEDCQHFRQHRGVIMCHRMTPFLAYKETQRLKPQYGTMNCGIEGTGFLPNKMLSASGE